MPPSEESDELTGGHPSAHVNDGPAASANPAATGPISATWPSQAPATDDVVYGPDIAGESVLRLLGNLEGKRILELGVGNGSNAVFLASHGAKVITIDPSAARIERAKALAEQHELRLELHHEDLAAAAMVRADTIDLVLSVYAIAGESDPDRVFRQAHRVLRPECPIVVSVPHPAGNLLDPTGADVSRLANSWFDRTPRPWSFEGESGSEYPRSFGDLFGGLHRANFRVETVLEPEPLGPPHSRWWNDAMTKVPATLILRGRKQGI